MMRLTLIFLEIIPKTCAWAVVPIALFGCSVIEYDAQPISNEDDQAPASEGIIAPIDYSEGEIVTDQNGVPTVLLETREIHAPLNLEGVDTPEATDTIRYYRYRLKTSDNKRYEPDAVLVFIPGIMCGANVFYVISHQILTMAKMERDKVFEVLVVERRTNTLEDMTGTAASERARDADIALNYYWKGAEVDGKKFDGFLNEWDTRYLSEFGLKLYFDDMYAVLTNEIPDQEDRREKVFVGGHSQAGSAIAYFAGWDFDGNPETIDDAGFRNCGGLVALDCVVRGDDTYMSKADYNRNLHLMRTGKSAVMLPFNNHGVSREVNRTSTGMHCSRR